jgi:hypothetical protein
VIVKDGEIVARGQGRGGARLDTLGAVVSIAFLTLTAVLLWLITTQIWHLP